MSSDKSASVPPAVCDAARISPTTELILSYLSKKGNFLAKEKKSAIADVMSIKDRLFAMVGKSAVAEAAKKAVESSLPKSMNQMKHGRFTADEVANCLFEIDAFITIAKQVAGPAFGIKDIKGPCDAVAEMVSEARCDANNILCDRKKAAFVKLSGSAKTRPYLVNAMLPEDEKYRYCVMCGHHSVDFPFSNFEKMEANEVSERDFLELSARYDENKGKGRDTIDPVTNKVMKQRPVLKLLKILNCCHCHHFLCGKLGGCPIKCIDPATKKKYGKDEHGICQCPFCLCKCDACYTVSTIEGINCWLLFLMLLIFYSYF